MQADWYEDATVYSVDVETFYDADGDGVGDFRGLREKLPYIDRLGVDCVWLLPFYPTPNRDNGYDIMDYYGVDERLGDLGDFTEFVDAAEERGIRVVADLVVNHTSDRHEWFRKAREDPDSKYRDYYVWTDDPENAPEKTLVFPGEEEDVWRYDEVADAYYYHRFYHFQPDLNIANPAVREEIYKILRFWLSLGVSGFRVDAATLMIEPKGEGDLVVEDPHGVFKNMKRTVRSATADGVLLAEADDAPEKLNEYFGDGDEMDLMLNFVLNAHVTHALATGSADPIEDGLERLPDPGDRGRFANFLRNFDELNLGRLDAEDQAATYEAFAPEEHMRIYDRGIRRRLGAMLSGDRDRIAMAHSLLFSLPGTPVLVAGDEIGMGDDLSLSGRNPVRTPIHWGDAPNAGFSTADADELVRPVIEEGEFGYDRVNVDAQRADADSLLHRIVRLVRARDELPALKRGRHAVLDDGPENVFAHRYEWDGGSVDCLHNLGTAETTVELPGTRRDAGGSDGGSQPADGDDARPVRVAGDAALRGEEATLGRYEYCWVRYGRP